MPTPASKEQTHRECYEAFRAWFMQSGVDFWSEWDAPEELATIAVELSDRFVAQRGAEADRLANLFARVIVEGEGAFTGGAWEAALCEAERINRPQTGGGDAPCATCKGEGRILYVYDRGPNDAPGNQMVGCPDCRAGQEYNRKIEAEMQSRMHPQAGGDGTDSKAIIMPLQSDQTGGGEAGERAREHASAVLYRVIEHHLAKTGEWADEDLDALRAGLAMLDSREADFRSSHREGAEAMREACKAVAVKRRDFDRQMQSGGWKVGGQTPADGIIAGIEALPIPGSKTDA